MKQDRLQQFEFEEHSKTYNRRAPWNPHNLGSAIAGYKGIIPFKTAENVLGTTWGTANGIARKIQAGFNKPLSRQDRQRLVGSVLPSKINPQSTPHVDIWSNDPYKRLQGTIYNGSLTQDLQYLPKCSDDVEAFDQVLTQNARVGRGSQRLPKKHYGSVNGRKYVCPAAYADKRGAAGICSYDIRLDLERQIMDDAGQKFSPNQKEAFGTLGRDFYVSRGDPRYTPSGI